MPISPRFHLGKQRRPCYPDKEFTNRDSQRSSFQTVVEELANVPEKGAKFKVITYYGVGGVGKSSLLKQLRKDLLKQSSKAAYSSVDFADPSLRVVSRALLELQRNITCNERLSLPHFELAYSLYFKKRNPDFVFKERDLPFKEESSLIGDLLGTLDGIGIAGAVTGGVSIAYKLFSKYGLEKELKNELVELEEYSAIEIEERLPAFFSYDLKRIIKQKEVPVFVAFFDTYEALWEEGKTDANLFSQDSWVRELVAHLPGVLFVFSGRDKLRWSTIDSDWENHLDQYLIDNLSEQDANIFLLNCGVEDEVLRGKIISASSGHPYHLNLSVDTYYELKNQGLEVTLEKFASSKRQVLDRFLRNLETSEIETLKILCVSRFFNKNVFEVMISNFRTGYPITKFDDFNRFCFINYENGKYFIHDLMRNSLIQALSQDALKATHETLADFYNLQLEKKQRLATQDVLTDAFSEENFHRSQYLSKDEYQNWLLNDKYKLLKFLQLRGEAKFLDAFLSNVTDHLGLEALNIRLVSIHIDVVHLGGSYKKAVNMIQEYLSQYSMAKILNSDELLHLFIRKIHHQMFYMPVPTLIQELLSIESEIDKKDLPARYNELLFMIGGNLGILSGDFRSSRRWLVKSIRFAKEHDFSDCLCRTLRKYSDLLRFHNHLDAANFFCNLGLDLAKDEGFKRYEIYLSCSKAEIFREKGLFHRAAELYRSAHDAAKQQGIKGWVAHTYLGFSECALALGNIDDAKIYLARANTIYKEIEQAWGLIQVGIGFSRCLLLEGDDTWMKIANNTLKRAEEMVYAKDISFLRSMIHDRQYNSNKLMFL